MEELRASKNSETRTCGESASGGHPSVSSAATTRLPRWAARRLDVFWTLRICPWRWVSLRSDSSHASSCLRRKCWISDAMNWTEASWMPFSSRYCPCHRGGGALRRLAWARRAQHRLPPRILKTWSWESTPTTPRLVRRMGFFPSGRWFRLPRKPCHYMSHNYRWHVVAVLPLFCSCGHLPKKCAPENKLARCGYQ